MQSLKISQTAEHKATAVHQHTFNFSYFCCFFHNVWSLPYKLMTKTVLQLRQKKTHTGSVTTNFPRVCQRGCFLSEAHSACYQNYSWVSGGHRLAMGNLGDQLAVSENDHADEVLLSKTP